jgi:hypothetical protein
MADASAGSKARYCKLKTFGPSVTFGAATPVPAAFFAIQSLAFSTLSSVPALGGDHDLVTKRFERLANQFLVGVGTIDLSRVEESYAQLHGATEELNHFAAVSSLAVSPTHTHASEAKRRNFET